MASQLLHHQHDVLERAACVDHAFQPIINTSTLTVYGFEALARLPGETDAGSVLALLDEAIERNLGVDVERILVRRAIAKFAASPFAQQAMLFCNIDNRALSNGLPDLNRLEDFIRQTGLSTGQICWEVSERNTLVSNPVVDSFIERKTGSKIRIALDDFGVGTSNLDRLLQIEPNYVKIDRCFIDKLAGSPRKQAIVAKLCGLAHALGYSTIAEGVEREEDFYLARSLGCDLAQGNLIASPTADPADLKLSYADVLGAAPTEQLPVGLREFIRRPEPIALDAPLAVAAKRFNDDQTLRFLPVVDGSGVVQGAIYEKDVRQILLSQFGRELIANRSSLKKIDEYVRKCPVAEASAPVEAIINSYVASESAAGLILLKEGQYVGYLSNHAVLRLASERDVSEAREQNPLTRLPGNHAIERHVDHVLGHSGPQTFAVIDFDHFKAFNDSYGFAAGDRALQLFADLMRELGRKSGAFVAHIGGDDFFVSLNMEPEAAETVIAGLCDRFAQDVESLYTAEDRAVGGIIGRDRFGTERFFPLLGASAGLLHLPISRAHLTREFIETSFARLKSEAKAAPSTIASEYAPGSAPGMMRERIEHAVGATGGQAVAQS